MMEKRTLVAFVCTLIILAVGVIVGVYFGLTIGREEADKPEVQPILDSNGAALSFFSQTDGLDIRWYSDANTDASLNQAIHGNYMMVSASVHSTLVNGSQIPVVGNNSQSTFTLAHWLRAVERRERIGVKLIFQSINAVEPALQVVRSSQYGRRPLWLEANVLSASGSEPAIDSQRFTQLVETHYPSAVMSLGWTTECCVGVYSQAMVEDMYSRVESSNNHVSFMIRASWLKDSLNSIRWLLEKSPRFSVTVWSPPDSVTWEGVSMFDLVALRNDHYIDRIYYQLRGKKMDIFSKMAVTAGNPMNLFGMPNRDGRDITWAHAVNSREKHKAALRGREHFLEADIILNGSYVPIMAHPPDNTSDLTFSDFVEGTLLTNKGMKLDFKSLAAVNPALRYLQSKYPIIHQPVWLNADVLPGPGGEGKTPVNGGRFLRLVRNRFTQATLSLGWTTGDGAVEYTADHVDAMLTLIGQIKQPITFPVRADLVRRSWPQLSRLLGISRSFSLTLWSNVRTPTVSVDDLVWIRQRGDRSRLYYDLPSETMTQFRARD